METRDLWPLFQRRNANRPPLCGSRIIVSTAFNSLSQSLPLGSQLSECSSTSVSTGVSPGLAGFLRRLGSFAAVALEVADLESAVVLRLRPGPAFGPVFAGFSGRPPIESKYSFKISGASSLRVNTNEHDHNIEARWRSIRTVGCLQVPESGPKDRRIPPI